MRPKKAAPGEGAVSHREHFVHYRCPVGLSKTTTGWCAAEPYWCIAHPYNEREGPTKLCLDWFTDGALKCPRCHRRAKKERLAYCFWWREFDTSPLFSICHETVADLLDGLEYGTNVIVGKLEQEASVFLKRCETQVRFVSEHPFRQGPIDFWSELLEVWDYDSLKQWCRDQDRSARARVENAPQPGEQTLSVTPPVNDDERGAIDAHKRFGHLDGIRGAPEWVGEAIKKIKPSKNGQHGTEGGAS